jgi:hypothetical protein
MFFLNILCFLFNKIGEQESGTGSAWKLGGQIIYTHVSKCKNDKIKLKLKLVLTKKVKTGTEYVSIKCCSGMQCKEPW